MKTKLLTLFVALAATTALWASNTITYTATEKLNGHNGSLEVGETTFGPAITSHTFNDGTGTITCSGEITEIGCDAFANCSGLTSITIPNSVTTIGDFAFPVCTGLTSITIPNSVTTIGNYAFAYCSGLTSIIIPNSVTTIGGAAFLDCNGLTSVTIGNSVTTIGSLAFAYCSGLTSITIPNSVTKIGDRAFSDCTGLTSIEIPNSVTKIEEGAFSGCSGLTSITIPNSVTTIGSSAFYGCSGLTSITCKATIPPICETMSCFNDVRKNIPVYVYPRSVNAYKQADVWKDFTNIQENPNDYVIVSCIAENGTISGGGRYIKGDTCMLTATANYGYHFTRWNDGNTDNQRTIIVTQDTTFTAEFTKNIYTISTQAEHGSIAGGGDYEYLSIVQLTATADEHYHFVQWTDGIKDNPRTITITEDTTYSVIFSIDQYTISATAEHGRVSGIGNHDYGTEVKLTVIPDVGYEFVSWSDGNTDNPRIVSVIEDVTYNCFCTQMIAGQCGNNLYWEYKEEKLIITGTGEMYDYAANEMPWFLYRDSVQNVEFSAGLTYIGCNAFVNFIRIEEITCYANQSPRVCSNSFDGLSKQYIYLYVPADYIRSYQINSSWNEFDIRTKSADKKPIDGDNPIVTPSDQDVTITWPITDGTDTYTLTITKNGEVVCVLTFNANGQLTNIAFAAPGHNGAHQAPAATLTAQGYQFTVTGLNPGTAYDYSVIATDAKGKTLAEHKGNFSTTGGESDLQNIRNGAKAFKYFHNGNLIIERNGVKYTPAGQKVR